MTVAVKNRKTPIAVRNLQNPGIELETEVNRLSSITAIGRFPVVKKYPILTSSPQLKFFAPDE